MKKSILLLCAVLMTFCFNACDDDEQVVYPYTYGITGYASSGLQDLTLLTTYLKGKGCFMDYKTFTGKNVAEIDAAAKTDFAEYAKKISVDEIKQLGLAKGCTFEYSVSRSKDPKVAGSGAVIIDKFSYVQE